MLKKFIALSLVLVMIFACISCISNNNSSTENSSFQTESSTESSKDSSSTAGDSSTDSSSSSASSNSSAETIKRSVAICEPSETWLYVEDSVQLQAISENGTVLWQIAQENSGCEIADNGLFTAGNKAGDVTVKAYLKEDNSIYDLLTLTVVEPMLASATALGTSHNNIIQENNFTYTFRTYFKVREYGEFEYSFYFDNRQDTSWWSVSNSVANRLGGKFTILSAYFADGGEVTDGAVCENTSVLVTFNGQTQKTVEEGEKFYSDAVNVNLPEGHFLAFTWSIKVNLPSGPSLLCSEVNFASCYKKAGDYASQESYNGFALSDSMFGTQIMVAPNKILYKRPKGKTLVFVGDSITQGVATKRDLYENWVAKVADSLPANHTIWNLGSGWATLGNLQTKGAWLEKAATADELFICLGVNDLGGELSLDSYSAMLQTVTSYVKEVNPNCIITLFTVPPFNYSGSAGNTWFAINNWIRQEKAPNVDKYFDFAGVLSKDYPNENIIKEEYMSYLTDAHPNGVAGEKIAQSFINWYNGESDDIAETYDRYINVDLGASLTLPEFVLVKTAGGFYDSKKVSWDKEISTSTAGVSTYTGTFDNSNKTVEYTVRIRSTLDPNAVYFVNCGNALQNDSTLYNSANDQVFGVDAKTGKSWGFVNDAPYCSQTFWNDQEMWSAVRCNTEKPGGGVYTTLLYKFQLEKGDYTISLGFKDPWSVSRRYKLTVDGGVLSNSFSNGAGAQTTVSFDFSVASDKIVEVYLQDLSYNGCCLNWMSITKEGKPANNDLLKAEAGNKYVKLEWSEAFGATEYEVVYGRESGKYISVPITVTGKSCIIKNLKNGTSYYFVVRAKNQYGYSDYSNEIKAVPAPVNDSNVVYNVDCGSNGVYAYNTAFGTNQSTDDQALGKDGATDYAWGYTTDGAPWSSGDAHPDQSVLVANLSSCGFENKGIHYSFEVANGNYTVELTFYDEWKSRNRITDAYINGKKVLQSYCYLGEAQTFVYNVTVENGNITIDIVGGVGNKDNVMISKIKIVKA